MESNPAPSIEAGTLFSVAPVLCVTDIPRTRDYLVERLGFFVQGSAGDPPSWSSLCRNGVEIMLLCGNHPAPAQDWAAYFYVRDVDALYAEFKTRGADIVAPPQNKPYDNREFDVRLPDGRQLAFGGDIPRS
jgi:hypothetical protein